MKDNPSFEQQLLAMAPAPIQTDASTAMYRCGFAAGQASRSDSDTTTRPAWLQLAVAACLTALLVGPVSYRLGNSKLGHSNRGIIVAEQESPSTVPVIESVDTVEPASAMSSDKPTEQVDESPMRTVPPKRGSLNLASWLIGIPSPTTTPPDASIGNGVILTSRPPSPDMMAWLEQSRPRVASHLDYANPMFDATDNESIEGQTKESNPHRLSPLPSRKSLHTWETWFQS